MHAMRSRWNLDGRSSTSIVHQHESKYVGIAEAVERRWDEQNRDTLNRRGRRCIARRLDRVVRDLRPVGTDGRNRRTVHADTRRALRGALGVVARAGGNLRELCRHRPCRGNQTLELAEHGVGGSMCRRIRGESVECAATDASTPNGKITTFGVNA